MLRTTLLLYVTPAGYIFFGIILLTILWLKFWPRDKKIKTAKFLFKIMLKLFLLIAGGLLLVLIGGMGYFVYQRLFTHEKDDAPLWAVLLCIFFLATILLVIAGQLLNGGNGHKTGKTDFDNLKEALLTPEAVLRLSLVSGGFTTLPGDILKFKNLSYLDLSNNQLATLPAQLLELKHLATVKLSGNPVSDEERAKLRRTFPPELELIFRN